MSTVPAGIKLTPVDYDPFTEIDKTEVEKLKGVRLTPVDHDPFSGLLPPIPVKDNAGAERIRKSISNSYVFGIPAGDAYRLHDQLEQGKAEKGINIQWLKGTSTLGIYHPEQVRRGILQPPEPMTIKDVKRGIFKKLPEGISAGAAGTVAGMLSGVEWLLDDVPGLRGLAELAKEGSEVLRTGIEAMKPERTFFTDIGAVIGSMGTFLLPGGIVSRGIGKISTVAPSVANWLGIGTMTGLEALTEAGAAFDEKREFINRQNEANKDIEGYVPEDPEAEAEKAARITFVSNVPLLLITNRLGIFADKGTAISKAIRSYMTEGTQESMQEVISTLAIGDPERPLKLEDIVYAGILGGFGGAGASLFLSMIDSAGREARRATQMPADVKAVYEGTVDGLEATGVDSETAHKEATRVIARLESGQEYLNQVGQALDSAMAVDAVIEKVRQEIIQTGERAKEIAPDIEQALTVFEEALYGEREITDKEILGVMEEIIGAKEWEIVVPPESAEVPVTREAWEMTKEEWLSQFPEGQRPEDIAGPIEIHKEHIQKALSEGRPVPAGVLKDYPDLRARAVPPRLISDEMYQKAHKRIKEKLRGLKAGIDPTILPDMVITGAYHIESGIRRFVDWSKVMIKKYGERVKPHLRDIWRQAREYLKQRMPAKEVKGLVRKVTGQVRDKELSDLGYAFIKAARAAREAYRTGNKEGVARERARMQDIMMKARLRMEELISIKKDIKTLKKIQEKAEGKIALDYQEKIRELLKDVDFSKPTEKTIERLQGLSDFISREGVPLGISQAELNRLERLSRTPFRDLSKEARRELVETAKKLYDLGKLKRKLQLNEELRKQTKALDKLITSTVNLDPILSGERRLTKLDKFKIGFKKINMDVLHSFRQADIADGLKDYQGENAKMIKEQLHAEIDIRNTHRDMMLNILQKIQKLGIENIDYESDMAKRINVVLYYEQDARGQTRALMEKYGMDQIPVLNDTERALIEILRAPFDEVVDDTVSVFEKRENRKFVRVKNYFPIRYEGEVDITPSDSIDQNRHRTRQVRQEFVKERLPYVERTPREDFLAILEESLLNQLWYNKMQPILDRHHALVRTPEYKAVAGDMMWNWWKDQIDIVARKGWSATAKSNLALREIRVNLNQAILGYRISSILMQPFAIFDAVAYTISRWGPSAGADVAIEFSKAWINPKAALEFVENTPALRLRREGLGELAVEEVLERAKGYKGIWRGFVKGALKGLQLADIITASGVEKGLLKVLKKHNVENAEAEADFLMNLASGSSEITLRPHILARGDAARTWFTFQTFFLNRWGIVSHDILRTGFRGNWKRKATAVLGLMIMMAGGMLETEARKLIYRLTTGKDLKLDESMLKKIILYLPRQIPVIGGLFEEWATAEPPVLRVIERIGKGVQQIVEGRPISGFEKTIEGLMTLLLGIPGTAQIFDFLEYLLAETKEEEIQKTKED